MQSAQKFVRSVKLDGLLERLQATPKLQLKNVKALNVSYAFRNDHFGARHFTKEFLPRIAYANPGVQINVEKMRKEPQDKWKPSIEVVYEDSTSQVLSLHEKWSTAIAKDLLDAAGTDAWKRYKSSSQANGRPVFPGEEGETSGESSTTPDSLPTLAQFKASPEGQQAIERAKIAAQKDMDRRMKRSQFLRKKAGIEEEPKKRKNQRMTI
ncbi:hypothetical protein CYLTODRAFT_424471 [Cylindrobasidium torrendii FP15055 ss-10]|uniref:Ribosomal protein/NADH dehydrogenase domain-containing protein n=1 Tax=Cylindrobasidium torrendii FP15055 ss-10 TaxID=1314674 RepID=A0A0D7B507_9AGAR|nr:hypothetical protein CYLTODRAFT_424471 [Cylindrobasidium torrendii FP15055 ss-10]